MNKIWDGNLLRKSEMEIYEYDLGWKFMNKIWDGNVWIKSEMEIYEWVLRWIECDLKIEILNKNKWARRS